MDIYVLRYCGGGGGGQSKKNYKNRIVPLVSLKSNTNLIIKKSDYKEGITICFRVMSIHINTPVVDIERATVANAIWTV